MNADPSLYNLPPVALDDLIARLAGQQAALARRIDRCWSDLDPLPLARLLSLHGENAARLGLLLRHWHAIHGPPQNPLDAAIDAALHKLGTEWGIELIDPKLLDEDERARPPLELDDVIAGLSALQDRLSELLDCRSDDLEDLHLARLLAAYSRNTARLGRLLRQRHDLGGTVPDAILRAMAEYAYSLEE